MIEVLDTVGSIKRAHRVVVADEEKEDKAILEMETISSHGLQLDFGQGWLRIGGEGLILNHRENRILKAIVAAHTEIDCRGEASV